MFAEYGVLNYWTYLVGAIFIVLVPGPNTLFVLKNSVSSGMKGGYLAACGVFIGDAVLMFLAWAGVATLIKTTPILFNIVRYLGAFYLLYLGSKILYATLKGKNSETKSDEPQYGAIFKRALILSLTNPKAILFYVSFFVQFIDVNAPYGNFILYSGDDAGTGEFLLFELPDYFWGFCHAVHTYQKETG